MYFVRCKDVHYLRNFTAHEHRTILVFSFLFKPYFYKEGRKFIFHVFDVKMRIFGGLHCHGFCTKGNGDFLFEQTLLFMMTKFRSKRTQVTPEVKPNDSQLE